MVNWDDKEIICKECNKVCYGYKGLSQHLRQSHNIIKKDLEHYWINYLAPSNFIINCPICGDNKKFNSLKYGYASTCCSSSCRGKYSASFYTGKKRNIDRSILYECEFCNEHFESIPSLQCHLFGRKIPCYDIQLTAKEYYIKYLNTEENFDITCPVCKITDRFFKSMTKGFSPTCKSRKCVGSYGNLLKPNPYERKLRKFKNEIKCEICNKSYELDKGLASHLSQQLDHPTPEEYYNKYLKPNDNSICPICNERKRNFIDIQNGYTDTCCDIKCINKKINDTKWENGTFNGQGYSKFPINNIFDPLIKKYNIDKNRCHHAELNKELVFFVGNKLEFKKRDIKAISYDFVITDKNNNRIPLLVCEFHGICFHLKKEEVWKRRHEKDFYGNSLIKSYRKDILKKKYIQSRYPSCKYIIIWENDLESGYKQLDECMFNLDTPINDILTW